MLSIVHASFIPPFVHFRLFHERQEREREYFKKKKKGEVYRTVAIGSNKNQREVLTLLFLCRYHYSPSVDRGDRFYYIRAAEYYTFARRR